MTTPQTILDEVNSKLEEAIGGLHKWQRLYKDLQYKYNELALQSFEQKTLAQPEQERKWVGLTDADIAQTMHGSVEGSNMLPYQFARVIEAKLKEKNGG